MFETTNQSINAGFSSHVWLLKSQPIPISVVIAAKPVSFQLDHWQFFVLRAQEAHFTLPSPDAFAPMPPIWVMTLEIEIKKTHTKTIKNYTQGVNLTCILPLNAHLLWHCENEAHHAVEVTSRAICNNSWRAPNQCKAYKVDESPLWKSPKHCTRAVIMHRVFSAWT